MSYNINTDPQAVNVLAADLTLCSTILFPTQELYEVEDFLLSVSNSDWFKREYPQFDGIELVHGDCWSVRSQGWPKTSCIVAIPKEPRHPILALHALAHGLKPYCAHGPMFCRTHLQLVRQFVGKEAADLLKRAYVHLGVRHQKPRMPNGCAKILNKGWTSISGVLALDVAGFFRDEF